LRSHLDACAECRAFLARYDAFTRGILAGSSEVEAVERGSNVVGWQAGREAGGFVDASTEASLFAGASREDLEGRRRRRDVWRRVCAEEMQPFVPGASRPGTLSARLLRWRGLAAAAVFAAACLVVWSRAVGPRPPSTLDPEEVASGISAALSLEERAATPEARAAAQGRPEADGRLRSLADLRWVLAAPDDDDVRGRAVPAGGRPLSQEVFLLSVGAPTDASGLEPRVRRRAETGADGPVAARSLRRVVLQVIVGTDGAEKRDAEAFRVGGYGGRLFLVPEAVLSARYGEAAARVQPVAIEFAPRALLELGAPDTLWLEERIVRSQVFRVLRVADRFDLELPVMTSGLGGDAHWPPFARVSRGFIPRVDDFSPGFPEGPRS
jgi:hypothetical protein